MPEYLQGRSCWHHEWCMHGNGKRAAKDLSADVSEGLDGSDLQTFC